MRQKNFVERSMMQHKKGFTLIELLVVIAIISILAAILFPVFARARENARRASCQSNLKQVGLGVMQYLQDFDERYPQQFYWDTTTWTTSELDTDTSKPSGNYVVEVSATGNYRTWMDAIFPYVKSVQIFTCPSVPSTTPAPPSYGYNTAFGGYANDVFYYNNGSSDNWRPLAQAQVGRPAELVLILDFWSKYNVTTTPAIVGNWSNHSNPDVKRWLSPHLEGGNIAYADGHVKWQTLQKLQSLQPFSASNTMVRCDPALYNQAPYNTYSSCSPAWNPYIQ